MRNFPMSCPLIFLSITIKKHSHGFFPKVLMPVWWGLGKEIDRVHLHSTGLDNRDRVIEMI
jgi:hypothetical protein